MNPRETRIDQYDFELSEEFIPAFPLPERDASKLLLCKQGVIQHRQFMELPDILESDDLLVFNNTKVIPARLLFKKETGAFIEVFCLEPIGITHQDAMMKTGQSRWKCFVGGAKKWKEEQVIFIEAHTAGGEHFRIEATRLTSEEGTFELEFNWTPSELSFSEVLDLIGRIPLPPYIKREATLFDVERYQTILAKTPGSVAAPTAALHFTDRVLNQLQTKGVQRIEVTLHVGAGTFKPVSSQTLGEHDMHAEVVQVSIAAIEQLLDRSKGRNIAVGTTSMRTLETLYWMGVKLLEYGTSHANDELVLSQWDPYELTPVNRRDALQALLDYAKERSQEHISITTSVLIAPGYTFRICDGLITNFHMPKSTLIVLVAALIGDRWREVYQSAITERYRFLSYGDSSLLIP